MLRASVERTTTTYLNNTRCVISLVTRYAVGGDDESYTMAKVNKHVEI